MIPRLLPTKIRSEQGFSGIEIDSFIKIEGNIDSDKLNDIEGLARAGANALNKELRLLGVL